MTPAAICEQFFFPLSYYTPLSNFIFINTYCLLFAHSFAIVFVTSIDRLFSLSPSNLHDKGYHSRFKS